MSSNDLWPYWWQLLPLSRWANCADVIANRANWIIAFVPVFYNKELTTHLLALIRSQSWERLITSLQVYLLCRLNLESRQWIPPQICRPTLKNLLIAAWGEHIFSDIGRAHLISQCSQLWETYNITVAVLCRNLHLLVISLITLGKQLISLTSISATVLHLKDLQTC